MTVTGVKIHVTHLRCIVTFLGIHVTHFGGQGLCFLGDQVTAFKPSVTMIGCRCCERSNKMWISLEVLHIGDDKTEDHCLEGQVIFLYFFINWGYNPFNPEDH